VLILIQSGGINGTPTMAEKMAYLKTLNANGDFADFTRQTVEQCMFSLMLFHISDVLHVTLCDQL